MTDELIRELDQRLPAVFTRKFICRELGGILTSRTLANLDCRGDGPENRFLQGRVTFYKKSDFLRWFAERIKTPRRGRIGEQDSESQEA